MPPPPEPTDADREAAEKWVATTVGKGIAVRTSELRAATEGFLAGILHERANISEDHDMANGCLSMIHDALASFGCSHGKGQHNDTPPMMYPEWIACVVNHHVSAEREQAAQRAIRVLGGEQNEWAREVAAAIRRGPQNEEKS